MSDTTYALYYYDQCPFCQRVLHMLKDVKVEVSLKNTLSEPKNRQDLQAGAGRTTVPCLRITKDGNDHWMFESMDIIRYLQQL